jgi:hypothetical protein
MRPGDDVNADELAFDCFDCLRAGIRRCFYSRDIANDDSGHERIADLCHRSRQFNVCRFEHRVGPLDEGDEAAGFNESNCLMSHD